MKRSLLFLYVLITLFTITMLATGALADKHELDEITKAVKLKKARWTSGQTSISRLLKAERKKLLGSQRPEATGKERVLALPSVQLPEKLDWRNYNGYNYVTPVKEQGSCGACWAFAPTAALESNILISENIPDTDLDLSEQTLISCGFSGTCDGGYIDAASDFISTVGLPPESCYPFGAEEGFCSSACSNWTENTYKTNGWFKVNPTVESIKYALYNLGPLVTIITAQTDFFYYKEGVYSHTWGSFEGYHSALIVGYDDIDQCFIVKSSWGTDWGEDGYSRIAYSEVNSETQFGLWTIAYETAFPSEFPTIDGVPRNTDIESIENEDNNESDEMVSISGIVRDQSGNPVDNAQIKVIKYTVNTDSIGKYYISSIPADSHIIIVKKSGYSTIVENISLTQDTINTKDFVMLPLNSGEADDDDPAEPEDPEWEVEPEGGGDLGVLGPGWHNVTGKDITPKEAQYYFADRRKKLLATKSDMMPMSGAAADINSDLQELARGLRNDPKLIYDYVHNNIDYVPYYGSRKGAYLTYMDGSGNDFDQASLMIALLRAAGYNAQYVYGQMTIPGDQIANWFDVDLTQTTIHSVLHIGGIPHITPLSNGDTTLDRVWVKATIDGEDYLFDPAFKSYTYESKINLGAAMGYNQSALLSAAGGTLGDNGYSIRNMNEGNLKSQLATYAGNLADYIRSQHPNADLSQIISGRSIIQTNMTDYQATLPFSPVMTADWPKDDIPIEMTSQLSIGFCSDPCSTTEPWPENCNCNQDNSEIFTMINTPDLGGKRITLAFESTGIAKLCVEGGNCLTGSSTTPDYMYLKIKIDHPLTSHDQRVRYNVKRGTGYSNKYAVVYNFGGVSDILLRKRQEKLDAYKDQGLADTTEAVRGETLNIMGQKWLKEVAMTNNTLSLLAETVGLVHHNIGLMCQEEGYFIDVKVALFSSTSKHYPDTNNHGHFLNMGLLGSAFEHGMLEQLTGSDKPAASTIKLLQIANAGGGKIFYVNSTSKDSILGTAADCSDTQLTGYTCSGDISGFKNSAGGSHTLILPANGQLVLNEWKGKGYIDKTSSSMGLIIGGNYFGGYNSYKGYVSTPTVSYYNKTNTYTAPTPVNIKNTITTVNTSASEDPVDMAGGAFLNDHTDLAMGGSAPLGLAFSRSYTSSKNTVKRTLGYGWSHNYDIYLSPTSHSEPVFGSRQPVEAVSLIAAIYASLDLLRTQDNIQGWMTASLATKWAVDQMIDNAININLGSKVMEYVKLPDGTYSAPPGITTQLIKNTDETFRLQERFGTVMNFNTDKKLAEIKDIDNNTMTFTYNTDKNLSSVRDAFNRTLTINYSSGRISSVNDSSSPARTVSYGYDGSDNLTTYTDPEGKIWAYGYDTAHRMTTVTNPLSIITATNIYDTEGRVMTQRVPRQGGGTTDYSFYFSGYRNQEVDPDGNALTYYYDAKGREYAQEDPLGNKFTKTFDGQDHVIKTVDPKGNISEFDFDGNHNLIRTKSPLPGTEYDLEYDYDALFRKTDAWYALNSVRQKKVSHFDYDAEHHLIMTTSYPESGKEISTSTTPYPNGFPYTIADGRGVLSTMTYDTFGNPDTSRVSAEPVIDYTYDAVGRMVQLEDQAGAITSFVFDDRGLLQSKTDPLGKSTTLTYYDDGSLHTKTDRNNNTITLSYTPSGQPETITYPDTSTVNFNYNHLDNLESMQDSTGITGYTYDEANRLKTKTDSFAHMVSYDYDEAGNVKKLTYPGNKSVSYTYDELNRMKTVTLDWLSQTATYNYDTTGRLASLNNFNGTISTYDYDDANRLVLLENRQPGGAAIATYQFDLDENGNRTNIIKDEPLTDTAALENINYTYNTYKNRLLSDGANNFDYDDEGQIANGYGSNYTFDYDHRLTAIGSNYFYTYDATGNRIKAVRNSVETRYIYDAGGNLIAEADSNNVITRYYIYGQGLMAMVTPSDQVYCYHYNAIGSTIAMTDGSQNIVNKYAYDEFGNINSEVEAVSQPFKYVGQHGVMAEPNGFYYMRARYYDPKVGRFVSEDPSGFDGGDVNLYVYVGNNPIIFIDPWGLCAQNSFWGNVKTIGSGILQAVGDAGYDLRYNKQMHQGLATGAVAALKVNILSAEVVGVNVAAVLAVANPHTAASIVLHPATLPGATLFVEGMLSEGPPDTPIGVAGSIFRKVNNWALDLP